MPFKDLHEVEPARPAQGDKPSASPVWTSVLSKDGAPTMVGVSSLYEVFKSSVDQKAGNRCLGVRGVNDDGTPGPYQWQTYAEVGKKVEALSAFFAGKCGTVAHGRIGVLGANCPEWMISQQACNRMTYYVVPLYDTLGEKAVEYILEHAEVTVVVVSAAKLSILAEALPAVPAVKNVVVWGTISDTVAAEVQKIKTAGVDVTPYDEAIAFGTAHPTPAVPPAPQDLSTIMYTSGTTGDPKGVMLTHAAIMASVASQNAFLASFPKLGGLTEKDVYLSYLPLAHIFDRAVEEMMLSLGGSIGYWRGDIKGLVGPTGDIVACKPTLFCGVPRVFDRIYAGFNTKINAVPGVGGWVKRRLYQWGYSRKAHTLTTGTPQAEAAPFFDKLVFSKVKEALGGSVRIIVSGGAPLAAHVETWLRVAMCAPVVQGYGLTETCAASFIAHPDHMPHANTVGPPQPCTKFRLESLPEMKYEASADPPRGEVLVSGGALFSGYYKQDELTAGVLSDGWFRTGDVGEVCADGALRIIDRAKNIFKLSQGEYVAVEKVEGVLKSSTMVEQLWVYGNSLESSLVAVVVPSAAATEAAKQMGVPVTDAKVADMVAKDLATVGKEKKLKGFELPRKVIMETEEFSVENDLMTPTFKLKRPQLKNKYSDRIDAAYAEINGSAPKP